jgi:hypothetical protein
MVLVLISAMAAPFYGKTPIQVLSQDDQQAMQWASQNTPMDSKFAVVTGGEWPTDSVSEWFPSLANRTSITTVQGSEWSSGNEFQKLISNYNLLQTCSGKDLSCVNDWAKNNNVSLEYIYIVKPKVGGDGTSLPPSNSLVLPDNIQLVSDNPGVSIYKMVDNP